MSNVSVTKSGIKVNRGRFIVVEGIDGSGKSTFVKNLQLQLKVAGRESHVVNILRDEPASAEIRKIVTATPHPLDPTSEALLYMAAVVNTYNQRIVPKLEAGIDVICDRAHISTLAYQVNAQTKRGNIIPASIAPLVYKDINPDAIVFLYTNIQEGKKRVVAREGQLDRIESRPDSYFEEVQNFFKTYQDIHKTDKSIYSYDNDKGVAELNDFAGLVAATLIF